MQPVDVVAEAQFNADKVQPKVLYSSQNLRVFVVAMRAGQEVAPHPSTLAIFCILKGRGTFSIDDLNYPVQAGSLLVGADGTSRGLKCDEEIILVGARAL